MNDPQKTVLRMHGSVGAATLETGKGGGDGGS